MRTAFSSSQLEDPHLKAAETSFRACVHCGFCTATCPTYVLLGDERDSPRGRIALMQRMLETNAAPSAETVMHIDRCLSCLGCRTTCPSSVDYADLIDTARVHIAKKYRRPWPEKLFRGMVLFFLTHPTVFAGALALGRFFAPIAKILPGKLGAMARKIPPAKCLAAEQQETPKVNQAAPCVALLPGCVQRVLGPEIDLAARRVLARQGINAVALRNTGCCGALALHMGKDNVAKDQARTLMDEVDRAFASAGDVLITASGCAAFLKDYAKLFAGEHDEMRAHAFASRVRDFSELAEPAPARGPTGKVRVAYHPPCSLQHGQRLVGQGEALLKAAGVSLVPFSEPHLCCGSAGSYSLLQPEISEALRERKLAALSASDAEIIVTGNIGCLMQLSSSNGLPALHLAEILDWAGGGPVPSSMKIRRANGLNR